MKIFYISVIENNAGWGAEYFVNRGFVENGHETITLDYRRHRHVLGDRFLEVKDDFDALFLQRGDFFPLELLRAVDRPRFFWATELVSRNRDQDRLFECGLFEHVFVHSAECRRTLTEKGVLPEEKVSTLVNGFDPRVFRKLPGVPKDIDVLYMGGKTPRREEWLECLGRRLNITQVRAFGDELNTYFNRAKIILNFHAEDFLDTETRVFETLGCGTFLLSEKLGDENPFTPGLHYIEADGIDDMAEKALHYLADEAGREEVAACGHQEALSGHTYAKRAETIASVFAKHPARRSGPPIDFGQVRAYAKSHRMEKIVGTVKEKTPKSVKNIIKKTIK